MNAAKGRLKSILHRGLFKSCDQLFKSDCTCKEKTLFDYQKHLHDIGVRPLETVCLYNPMNRILNLLDNFKYKPSPDACITCRRGYKSSVAKTQQDVRIYFDSLCLDCIDKTKPKINDDVDADYWNHVDLGTDKWDSGCRIRHGEPTFYFSFMGRKEDRDRWVRAFNKNRRPVHYDYDD